MSVRRGGSARSAARGMRTVRIKTSANAGADASGAHLATVSTGGHCEVGAAGSHHVAIATAGAGQKQHTEASLEHLARIQAEDELLLLAALDD